MPELIEAPKLNLKYVTYYVDERFAKAVSIKASREARRRHLSQVSKGAIVTTLCLKDDKEFREIYKAVCEAKEKP